MDRITKSYLSTFRKEQSLDRAIEDSVAFEHLANYCAVSNVYDDSFSIDDVHVGGPGDLGLDGIAIIVNGRLVTSEEEVKDLLEINGFLDVTFVFIQGKTSSNFSGEQCMTFFDGVDEFFSQTPTLPMNEEVASKRAVMAAIYEKGVSFTNYKPRCQLYYVTTGQWVDDELITGKIKKRVAGLQATGLFSSIDVRPWGADELQAAYQKTKNIVSAEFVFDNKVTLPEINGVTQAYLGVVPAAEFLKLITDTAGSIRKQLFYDNIRDFQEYNEVNKDIKATLENAGAQQRFPVLNNGVTVVARNLQTVGNRFTISDFQIVNGCQTSHVIFGERDRLAAGGVFVPLKVIVTNDDDLTSAVIRATNRQTEVTSEDLYAMSTFQKKLEILYKAYPDDKKRLYYERRSRQYNAVPDVEKVRIITKLQQFRAFAAMFLDDPHRAFGYYSELRASIGDRIFNEKHKLDPYYVSAYAYYKLEFLFRNSLIESSYKPARYHLLMAFRHIAGGGEVMPTLTANAVEKYCDTIAKQLWDDGTAQEIFKKASVAVSVASQGRELTRDSVKTQGFTDAVKKAAIGLAKKA